MIKFEFENLYYKSFSFHTSSHFVPVKSYHLNHEQTILKWNRLIQV